MSRPRFSPTHVSLLALLTGLAYAGAGTASPLPYLPDPMLQECLTEQAAQNGWQSAEEVSALACSGRRVADVAGIEALVNLGDLDLSANVIFQVWPLAQIHLLTALDLSGNVRLDVATVRQAIENNTGLTRLGLNGIAIGDIANLGILWNPATGQPYDLVELDLGNTGLTDSTGEPRVEFLRSFPNLERLNLAGNDIVDIMPLDSLHRLTDLDLSDNAIFTVWPLTQLETLTALDLSGNPVMDIYSVRQVVERNWGLTRLGLNGIAIGDIANLGPMWNPVTGQPYDLVKLDLGNTGLTDSTGEPRVEFLRSFPNLERLNLAGNDIVDIMPLDSLHRLTDLDLSDNAIFTVWPLTQLETLTALDLSGNPVMDIYSVRQVVERNWGLTRLGLNGIAIGDIANLGPMWNPATGQPYDLVELDLGNTGLTDSTGEPRVEFLRSFPNLERLNLAGNGIADIMPLDSLRRLTELDLSDNAIFTVWPLTQLETLTALYLSGNPVMDIYSVRQVVERNWGLTRLGLNGIAIGDIANLGPMWNPATGQPYDLVELDLGNTGLTDSTGEPRVEFLRSFPNLERLNLAGNGIADIMPLDSLRRLTELDLSDNAIFTVWPLTQLETLTALYLSGNPIADLGAVRQVIEKNWWLTRLGLNGIAIGDIANLGPMWNPVTGQPYDLVELDLGNTGLTDSTGQPRIDFLQSFPGLEQLNLAGNGIQDIFPLATLQGLTELDLSNNAIFDLWPLTQMHAIENLSLSGNPEIWVEMVRQAVESNPRLTRLGVAGIQVGDLTNLGILWNPMTGQPYDMVELDLGNTGLTDAMGQPRVDMLLSFPNLEQLDLTGNGIADIVPLAGLRRLKDLDLSHNAFLSIDPLIELRSLQRLSLIGNDQIRCIDLDWLEASLPETEILRPVTCASDNLLPMVDAGPPQSVDEGVTVTLAGSASDPDGLIALYRWEQIDGPIAALSDSDSPVATFVAPAVAADTELTFRLTVTDDDGGVSAATTTVTVKDIPLPDLVVTSVEASPATVKRGSSLTVTGTILNRGSGPMAGYAFTGLYLSTDSDITTADRLGSTVSVYPGLDAGASSSFSRSVVIPSNLPPGWYYIGAIADYSQREAEADETNNSLAGTRIRVTR